jgi:soluble lytic murein transglycosylase-like protein
MPSPGIGLARVSVVALFAASAVLRADVHLVRKANGSALIFNDNVGSGWRVNGAAPTDSYLVGRRNAPSPYDTAIDSAARAAGVDPALVKSVMLVESNFNPVSVSRKGAGGLMQLMPDTARRFGVSNRFDAGQSIRAGVQYLSALLEQFKGDVALALAGYNAGEGAVARHSGVPPYRETREYIRRVLVARHGESSPATAAISGAFRGTPTGSVIRTAAVRVSSLNGTPVLSNTGVEFTERQAPVLGRVR